MDNLTGAKAKNYKELGDAIDLPDDVDKERIRRMILRYEKKNPGYILNCIQEARAQHQYSDTMGKTKKAVKYGEVNEGISGRLLFEIPEELYRDIEDAYPVMFKNKKHFRWFVANFKELMIPEEY